jgi:hypothetical protein
LLTTLYVLSTLAYMLRTNHNGGTFTSLSWSGYIIPQDYNSKFEVTAVEASWTVPQINVLAGDGYSSAWIGIGGHSEKTLIQVGTEQDVIGGQDTYSAWYEMLPALSVTIDEMVVAPGDNITASLSLIGYNANMWNIQLNDTSNGQVFNRNVNYNSSLTSGEWIVERPTINNQISNLCDFGTVPFSNCQITLNNIVGAIGNFTYSKIVMANELGAQLASSSKLSSDGSSFSVNYVAGS